MFKNDPDKSIETLADGGVAVLASEGIVAGCVEVTEAGASDANTSKPLDEKSDNRGYVRTSAGVGDEGLPDPEVYEAARRIDEERWAYRFAKRAFDIVFSATVLVLFCWLYALIAIAIKIDDPSGPVFFKQERVGKNGERFMMWKFRSMHANAEEQLDGLLQLNEKTGPVFKIARDPRITRVGRVIRKLSLASVIIGTPDAGEPTNSLSSAVKTSLEQQFYERLPEVVSCDAIHYSSPKFLSFGVFEGLQKALCETINQPGSDGRTGPCRYAAGFTSLPLHNARCLVYACDSQQMGRLNGGSIFGLLPNYRLTVGPVFEGVVA